MKELLEAGVHFGHQTKRWNPKMKKFIFGKRNGIYIIDLQKTLKQFKEASKFVTDLAARGKNLLFVGTKRQAQDAIYEEANRCGMFYVNTRWLGGTRTNVYTNRKSVHRPTENEGVLGQVTGECGRMSDGVTGFQCRQDAFGTRQLVKCSKCFVVGDTGIFGAACILEEGVLGPNARVIKPCGH